MEIETPIEITKPKQEIINEVTELKQATKRVVSEKQLESLAKLRERKKIKAMAKKLNEEEATKEIPKASILPTVIPTLPKVSSFNTFTITLAAIFSVFILYVTSKKKVRIDSQPVQQPIQQKSTPQNYSVLQLGF